MRRIRNDLKGIRGFSPRNIIRFLSSDNPMVPRRVRAVTPKWRKNSGTDTQLLEQQADRIKDAERKMGEMTSEINTLREQVNQDKIMIKIRDEKIENTLTRLEIADNLLAWTQKELATRDYQLRVANGTKETWASVACSCRLNQKENEMAHRATRMELQTRDYQLWEANEAIETWKFLACHWCMRLEDNEMTIRRILNMVQEHESPPKELEANTRRNEAAERATQGDQVNKKLTPTESRTVQASPPNQNPPSSESLKFIGRIIAFAPEKLEDLVKQGHISREEHEWTMGFLAFLVSNMRRIG